MNAPALRTTPLTERHRSLGAKMVDFGGFDMPLKYTSESAEHTAVREGVGIFDVSHMGEILIEGRDAMQALQRLLTNDAARISDGQAMYAGLLNERGGFVDDVIAYRISPTRFLICVNAGNQETDFLWIRAVVAGCGFECTVENVSANYAQIAVQGPKAEDVVATLCGGAVRDIAGYHFRGMPVLDDGDAIVARTGYTGEDGFELYVKPSVAVSVWDALLKAGATPCGLAARDTLRLEAGMCLYGNDIDADHTPIEANLGWIVKLEDRPPFIGADVLRGQKAKGAPRLLRGLLMMERGIARAGYAVTTAGGDAVGTVTSGTQSPHLNQAVAMAYLSREHAAPDTELMVVVRGKPLKAKVVRLPFYRRPA